MLGLMATAPDEREALQALPTKSPSCASSSTARRRPPRCSASSRRRRYRSSTCSIRAGDDRGVLDRLGVGDAPRPHPHVHRRGGLAARRRRDAPQPVDVVPPQPDAGQRTEHHPAEEPEEAFGTVASPMIPCRVSPAVVHLPDSPKTPLVMVGLGTGMAPFRSFIQQRVMQKAAGEEVGGLLLYFGARYEATEFLYGDEIRAYRDGILNHLKTAFSRDQEEDHAQLRIAEDQELLYDYMNKDARFYLCGPARHAEQMKDAVVTRSPRWAACRASRPTRR